MRDDEGCQGNPPPASAYFSPRSDQYSIPVSSRTKRVDPPHPPASPPTPAPFAPPQPPSPRPFLRFCHSSFSLRASPRARYCRPSQTNHLAPLSAFTTPLTCCARLVISRFPSLFISASISLRLFVHLSICVYLSLSFSLYDPLLANLLCSFSVAILYLRGLRFCLFTNLVALSQ